MREGKRIKLLVVDDEKGIVDFTMRIFTKKGFLAFGAHDGVTAVQIFQKERPDICLIDIHMPYSPFDGVETLRRIKAVDSNARCVMVTRITENEKVEESKKLGAFAYLTKPLGVTELDKAIQEAVKSFDPEKEGEPNG